MSNPMLKVSIKADRRLRVKGVSPPAPPHGRPMGGIGGGGISVSHPRIQCPPEGLVSGLVFGVGNGLTVRYGSGVVGANGFDIGVVLGVVTAVIAANGIGVTGANGLGEPRGAGCGVVIIDAAGC
jgi:hypothetical protein